MYYYSRGVFILEIISAVLFCLSVSFDGFAIGFGYGLRRFRPTALTNIITGVISAAFTAAALCFGKLLSHFVPAWLGDMVGIGILAAFGVYSIFSGFCGKDGFDGEFAERRLTLRQSTLLSVALSVDALGAGVGYAISGNAAIWLPVGVGCAHVLFLSAGLFLSRKTAHKLNFSKRLLSVLSGIIILAVALTRIFVR